MKLPSLATYTNSSYFRLNSAKNGILFTTIAGGARTSSGTAYARTELRQMKGSASSTASADWTCKSTQQMTVRQRLTKVASTPSAPNATIAQVHDADNDTIMVKFFGTKGSSTGALEARFNNDTSTVVLDSSYVLGEIMTLNVYTTSSGLRVVYKNETSGTTKDTGVVSWGSISGSCYFKAGLYIQNCSKTNIYGDSNSVCSSKPSSVIASDPWDTATLEMYSVNLVNPQ